jgi:hypothetical protein
MPHPPKSLKSIIVTDASTEIVDDLHAAQSGPYSGHPPDNQEFKPDEDQVEQGEDFGLEESLLRGEGDDWAVVLVKFETDEDEDASAYFWSFRGGHSPEGDEVFVAERRTGKEGGRKEDVVHIALKGEVLSIDEVSSLEAIFRFPALLTLLEVLLQLPRLTVPMPIDGKRDKFEKGHVEHLSTADLPSSTSQPLRHHISYQDRYKFQVRGQFVHI